MISIIIPTFNEEKLILQLLSQLADEGTKHEIIIVDAGSSDDTVEIAEPFARIIKADRKGRAYQLNLGANEAKGDIIWFLHADSKISKDILYKIESTIRSGYDAGSLTLYFYDQNSFIMDVVEIGSKFRAKQLKRIFGDQSFFVSKDLYYKVNGFDDIPIMEDWEFSKKIYNTGRVKVLKDKIGTSGRRFEEMGKIKTVVKMFMIKLKYVLGVPPEKLTKSYKEIR